MTLMPKWPAYLVAFLLGLVLSNGVKV